MEKHAKKNSSQEMTRRDISDNIIEIQCNRKKERFILAKKLLDTKEISIKVIKSALIITQINCNIVFVMLTKFNVLWTIITAGLRSPY